MDDLFHRNSSKHVAEYFVVVGMKFENLWQACVDLSRASPELTDPCSSPSEHSINLNLDILQTAFEASVLSRYPTTDHPFSSGPASLSYASRLPEGIEFFCFPQGLLFSTTPSFPKFHAFVHTSEDGSRMIGTCLYFSEELSTEEYDIVNKINSSMHHNELSGLMEFGTDSTKLYVLKGICILSYWPFIEPFKKFLMILYNMLGSDKANKIPIERYICNFIDDIPAPPAGKVDIVYYLNDDIIRFRCPPLNVPSTWLGFPLLPLFHCLSLHNILLLFSCVLTERQVLLISSQYSLLTICAESIMSLLYPLTWSHAYIPILPSRLLGVLGAPFPFLLGLPSAIYEANKSCVSNETIRVHLDQDSIDLGSLGPPPPLPEHRKQKLMTHLENTIPWYHPNVTSNMEIKKIYFKKTREKIRAYDDVHLDQSSHDLEREGSGKSTGKPFQVQSDKESTTSIASKGNVYTTYMPTKGVHNSYFGAGIISAGHGGSGKAAQSSVAQHVNVDLDDLEISETSIREGFLKFFINMLKDYKRYLVYGSEDLDPQKKFNYMDFMNGQIQYAF
ncbi:hypothetical protein EON65_00345 [archaeon]|nr:MAG: hypothetical protein EON65_00345 [archaeon]